MSTLPEEKHLTLQQRTMSFLSILNNRQAFSRNDLQGLVREMLDVGWNNPRPAQVTSDHLLTALKDLYHAYVRLLEAGRDRIVSLGGDCDPIDVMERGDPYLIRAKAAIAQAENPSVHVAAGVTGHD